MFALSRESADGGECFILKRKNQIHTFIKSKIHLKTNIVHNAWTTSLLKRYLIVRFNNRFEEELNANHINPPGAVR